MSFWPLSSRLANLAGVQELRGSFFIQMHLSNFKTKTLATTMAACLLLDEREKDVAIACLQLKSRLPSCLHLSMIFVNRSSLVG